MLSANEALTQVGEGGVPLSFTFDVTNAQSSRMIVPSFNLPIVDNAQELEKANNILKSECQDCDKSYWGLGIDVSIDIKRDGHQIKLTNGGSLWLYKVVSINAYSLQIYFDRFKLPSGAKLFLYNEDKTMLLGAFTSKNNRQNEKLAIQPIKGNSVIIEYFEPVDVEFSGELYVNRVIHDFKGLFEVSESFGTAQETCYKTLPVPKMNGKTKLVQLL